MIYLLTRPQDKLEGKGRVSGWRHTPLEGKAKGALHELARRLKGKGVGYVMASDLDAEAGRIVSHELDVPFRESFGLRRFNVGQHHAKRASHVIGVLERVVERWRDNRDIPIRGGDSLTSLEHRLGKAVDAARGTGDTFVLVTDAWTANYIAQREPKALLLDGSGYQPGKVYCERPN